MADQQLRTEPHISDPPPRLCHPLYSTDPDSPSYYRNHISPLFYYLYRTQNSVRTGSVLNNDLEKIRKIVEYPTYIASIDYYESFPYKVLGIIQQARAAGGTSYIIYTTHSKLSFTSYPSPYEPSNPPVPSNDLDGILLHLINSTFLSNIEETPYSHSISSDFVYVCYGVLNIAGTHYRLTTAAATQVDFPLLLSALSELKDKALPNSFVLEFMEPVTATGQDCCTEDQRPHSVPEHWSATVST
jgi:hypothetical protein